MVLLPTEELYVRRVYLRPLMLRMNNIVCFSEDIRHAWVEGGVVRLLYDIFVISIEYYYKKNENKNKETTWLERRQGNQTKR